MAYIIDIIIIALFLFLVVAAYKKGFVSTVIDTFSLVISAVVSYKFFEQVAESVYNLFVRDLIETRFTRALDNVSSSVSISDRISKMIDGLPQGAVKLAEMMGVNFKSFNTSFASSGNMSNDELVSLAVDKIGHTIMINIVEVIVFVVMFVILAVAIKFLARLLKKVNDIPLLGNLNALLGGLIGVVKAVAIVFVVCTVFYFIAGMSGTTPVVEAINNSKIYAIIIENNPIINVIG